MFTGDCQSNIANFLNRAIVNLVANGMTQNEIIKEYPDIEPEDIRESLQYASWVTKEEVRFLVN